MEEKFTLWMPHPFPFDARFLSGAHARDWKVEPRKKIPQPNIDKKRQYYVLYMEGYVE